MNDAPEGQQAPPRRLTRSGSDRMVAGVAGGLADYTGIDPVVFRVVFAVAAILGGAGIAAYVLAWLIIPGPTGESSHASDFFGDRSGRPPWWLAIPLVVVFLLFAGAFDGWGRHWGGGGFGLLLIVGVGLWLWHRSSHPDATPVAPAPPPGTPTRPLVAGDATAETPVGPPVPPVPPVPPQPPRERSTLGILTFSAMLLVVGLLQAIEVGTDHDFHGSTILASALVVVGAGLLVGTFLGRSRGLIGLGIPLIVLTALASVADVPLRGGAGERRWAPVAEVQSEYRLGMGEGDLDLRGVELDGRRQTVDASVGMGQLRVWVPDGVDLEIRAHTGFGEVDLFGDTDDGVDVTRRIDIDEPRDDGTLVLDLRVGMGELEVIR